MSEQVDRTYICDVSGVEIKDTWSMLTVELEYGGMKKMTLHHDPNSSEKIHIHPDEHDISRGTDEPAELDVTAYVTNEGTIPMFTFEAGHFREHVSIANDDGWAKLAERIEREVIDHD